MLSMTHDLMTKIDRYTSLQIVELTEVERRRLIECKNRGAEDTFMRFSGPRGSEYFDAICTTMLRFCLRLRVRRSLSTSNEPSLTRT
jgi:hypothetical protein